MSLEELAAALDITYQPVQKYERGINRISASRLRHIAQ
jgi:transcriptional regulator with XRE-family HTH domain